MSKKTSSTHKAKFGGGSGSVIASGRLSNNKNSHIHSQDISLRNEEPVIFIPSVSINDDLGDDYGDDDSQDSVSFFLSFLSSLFLFTLPVFVFLNPDLLTNLFLPFGSCKNNN